MSNINDFYDRFTENAKVSLSNAEGIARSLGSNYLGTEHILMGVLANNTAIAAKILKTSGVNIDKARLALNIASRPVIVMSQGTNKELSENAKLALKMSWDIAQEFNQDYCGTEHILYSIITQKNARATILLRDMQADTDKIIDELERYLNRQQYDLMSRRSTPSRSKSRGGALDMFGTDVTALARSDKLDPLIGRERELNRMITILSRRHKNNPMLIGEPGVGKTALIDGLAQKIVNEDVPDNLIGKRLVLLDISSIIAGTKYRGEFEDRIKKVIKEIKSSKNIIVFIDEIHLLVGAGAAEGAVDAANMLKPMLARGEIKLIGATTIEEYKHIEKDSALERRFQTVIVGEPSKQETLAILRGIKKHYEEFHNVTIDDDVLRDTVKFSTRYINGRFLPDKAIDLIDEASATVRINKTKSSPDFRKLNREMRTVKEHMEQAVDEENYERAAHYKTRMIQIEDNLKKLRSELMQKNRLDVTSEDVAAAVSTSTGIPLKKVKKEEAKYLLGLENHLKKFVLGQDEALKEVSRAIRRNRSGVGDSNRPIGSFIFLGPSGVGKTELARVLARELYDNEDAFIKIDMSEFSERHTASKLIGAPAGFVGYDDSNKFIDKIHHNPYSLILFDEIEKAHPDIFNIFLQILEDGYVTSAKGRKIDFTNSVIIMTSNIGADLLKKEVALGFAADSKELHDDLDKLHKKNSAAVLGRLKKTLRPELLNRFDSTIVFRPLDKKVAKKILKLQIEQLYNRLAEQGVGLQITPKLSNYLLKKGYDEENGVRPLRRVIEQEVGDKLADGILRGDYSRGDVAKVDYKKGEIVAVKVQE